MEDFDLQGFLPYRINVLAARISRRLARVYEARFGITIAEWRVLAHLSQQDEVSIREIFRRVDLDKAKVTRAAQRLEARGLVRKAGNASDRRLVSLTLTENGRRMMHEIVPLALAFEQELLSALSAQRRVDLDDAIERLEACLDEAERPAEVAATLSGP